MSAPHPRPIPTDEDETIELSVGNGTASAALWWTHVPSLPGERLGAIGRFTATSQEAALEVLAQARRRLLGAGCTLAIGPMDGNTWRRYRWVTDAGTEPPFFLEPTNPPNYPAWWRDAGFSPLAEYTSTASDDLTTRDPRVATAEQRLRASGVAIRPLNRSAFTEELGRIYDVSVVSFQDNYLYTPLPREAFIAQYGPIEDRVQPELVLLAEHAGQPVGYVFATPDFAQAQRGEPVTTFIVKTLAVRPGRAFAGLGAVLLAQVHDHARQLGFRRVIHALMHESNKSRNLSAHYARTIRRYTLFQSRLASMVIV